MKNKTMILMALILAAATAASAATAFAESEKKQFNVSEQVSESVHATSQAILRLKVRALRNTGNNQPPVTIFAKPKPN